MEKALQLARNALQAQRGDVGIAFAEGIADINVAWYATVWCAAISNLSQIGFGGGLLTRLPDNLSNLAASGELTSEHLELFISSIDENPYQLLVQQAILDIRNQSSDLLP